METKKSREKRVRGEKRGRSSVETGKRAEDEGCEKRKSNAEEQVWGERRSSSR